MADSTSGSYIRPIVKSINNGGLLAIKLNHAVEFPDDMIDQLNTKKEALVVMQVVSEGSLPEPLPAKERSDLQDVVDWEANFVSDRLLIFRVLFKDPSKISASESTTNTLIVTMDLAAFESLEGKFIPDGSQIKRNLPAQMPVETAETYETFGSLISWIFLALIGTNGSLNTMFESLDYQALMDAIEGPQLLAFIPAMDVKLPPNVNYFLSLIKEAVTVEPSEKLKPKGSAPMSDNVFGEQPET